MKERPILFSASMVRAILEGRKTQTRRVIKPQPWEEYSAESIKCEHYAPCIVDKYGEMDAGPEIFGAYSTDGEWGVRCPYGQPGDQLWLRYNFTCGHSLAAENIGLFYGLTDDSIMVFHNNGKTITTCEWYPAKADTNCSKSGLYGRVGRADILSDKIQRLWSEGIRGLVSAKGFDVEQGIPEYLIMPQKQKGNKIGSSIGLHGFSWDAAFAVIAGAPPERESKRQQTGKSKMGVAKGELDGQKGPWERECRGETSHVKADGYGIGTCCMGNPKGVMQSATCSRDLGTVAGWHLCHLQTALICKPSIHMPRWASRITLEITGIRVERLQDITNNDALDEGTPDLRTIENRWDMRRCFQELWEQINGAGSWSENPWVWVIGFKKV